MWTVLGCWLHCSISSHCQASIAEVSDTTGLNASSHVGWNNHRLAMLFLEVVKFDLLRLLNCIGSRDGDGAAGFLLTAQYLSIECQLLGSKTSSYM
jgi:hypothetical protein